MGGFLQSVIFGYTGLRLREQGLTFSEPPAMPNNASSLVLHSLAFQDFQLRFERTAGMIRFDLLGRPPHPDTVLLVGWSAGRCLVEFQLRVGYVVLTRSPFLFSSFAQVTAGQQRIYLRAPGDFASIEPVVDCAVSVVAS